MQHLHEAIPHGDAVSVHNAMQSGSDPVSTRLDFAAREPEAGFSGKPSLVERVHVNRNAVFFADLGHAADVVVVRVGEKHAAKARAKFGETPFPRGKLRLRVDHERFPAERHEINEIPQGADLKLIDHTPRVRSVSHFAAIVERWQAGPTWGKVWTSMIHLVNITKQYGEKVLFKDAGFQVRPNDKIGLVGPNGAGKTTIFRIITGEEGVDAGEVSRSDRLVIGYFSQDVGEMRGRSALEEVKAGAGRISELARKLAEIEARLQNSAEHPIPDEEMEGLLEKYGEVQLEFEQRGGYELDSRAKAILTGLGIGPGDYGRPVETFSGGWKMRIALARILALNPDVLLMDEPTNHLDLESIMWLEEWLTEFKGAIVMTSHDREFMNRVVSRVVEIANKQITSYTGNYEFYLREREIRREQLLAAHSKQQDMLAKEEEFIARFAARASHAAQVQSRVKKIEKIERIEIPADEKTIRFEFPQPPRSGNDVVKMEGLAKSWPVDGGGGGAELAANKPEKKVFSGLTGIVRRLDKIAVVGVNGAGKSTLLKVISEQTAPTAGRVELGANVKIGYFSQHSLEVLNPEHTVYEEVYSRVPDATIGYVRNLCGAFLFSGDDVHKKVSVLSGGEKSRVVLATILANPVNLLVLDEPTNHLDIKSREVLLDAVKNFDGTVLIVSHDRHFLRALATRVFEIDHGEMRVYEGNYDYYLSKKKMGH